MSAEVGKFIPLGDRLTVVLDPDEMETTPSGVIAHLPGTREKPMFGTVTAVGDKVNKDLLNGPDAAGATWVDPSDDPRSKARIEEGSRVCFGRYSGTEIEINGEKLLVIRETDILGVVLPPAESTDAALYETGFYDRAGT